MSLPELYHLHPVAVHFPIALLTAGLGAACLNWWKGGRPQTSREAATWLLWLGTAAAWAAFGLGLLAQETVPHVPMAWETMAEHQTLATWTVGLFSVLSLWRFWMHRKKFVVGRGVMAAFLVLWFAAAGVLLATGYHGGELVFKYGVGMLEEEE